MSSRPPQGERESLGRRLLRSTEGVFEIFTVYLGVKLGLYQALAGGDAMTPEELARATGTQPRPVEEWLDAQAVWHIVERSEESGVRRYRLPADHVEVLVDEDSLDYLGGWVRLIVGVTRPMEDLLLAFREGGGVALESYGDDLREGQAETNRAAFLQLLGDEWLPAITDVHDRLNAQKTARVADIGCGAGWSSIAIARAYPSVIVDGFDRDEESIALARRNAEAADLSDRIHFHVEDVTRMEVRQSYDLVIALESVHDTASPAATLRTMRELAGDDGDVIVVEEKIFDIKEARDEE